MDRGGSKSPIHVHVAKNTPVHVHVKKKKTLQEVAGIPYAVEVSGHHDYLSGFSLS